MVEFLQKYGKEIFSLLVPILTFALNSLSKSKAELTFGRPHGFTFLINEPLLNENGEIIAPNQKAGTQHFRIENVGRAPATRVECVLNWKPRYLNIWPIRDYEEKTLPDGRYVLVFPSLAPREGISLQALTINGDMPNMITVRSDECLAREVQLQWVVAVGPWRVRGFVALALIGLGAAVYAAILLLQFLLVKTPV